MTRRDGKLRTLEGCVEETFTRIARILVTDGAGVVKFDQNPGFFGRTDFSVSLKGGQCYYVSLSIDGLNPENESYFAEVGYPDRFWNGYRHYVYAHRSAPEPLAKWVEWNLGPPLLLEWAARRWQRAFRSKRIARRRAARLIQAAFRRASADPGFLLCRRRLAREFEGLV
jgi:hypothetical protein